MKTTLLQAACPHCQAAIEYPVAQSGQLHTCAQCGGALQLPPAPQTPPPIPEPEAARGTEAQRIRHTAENFANAAKVVFALGIGIAILAFFASMNQATVDNFTQGQQSKGGGVFTIPAGICGSFAALAGWLYLAAQVLHIRANTTPDKL
jgi:hypothetical protein